MSADYSILVSITWVSHVQIQIQNTFILYRIYMGRHKNILYKLYKISQFFVFSETAEVPAGPLVLRPEKTASQLYLPMFGETSTDDPELEAELDSYSQASSASNQPTAAASGSAAGHSTEDDTYSMAGEFKCKFPILVYNFL